jgi:hypothetical protein
VNVKRRGKETACAASNADHEVDEKNKNQLGWVVMLFRTMMHMYIGKGSSIFLVDLPGKNDGEK